MLKRIKVIKQVGKYQDFNASNKEFSKFTIVEGENCAGKTTLIDIFKSLSTDKELDKRKTLPDNDEPVEIVMTFGEENSQETAYKYSDKKWNKKYPNIQVFDTEFINRNVINGFEIGRENKENFTKFVIGEESLSLLTEIDGISQGIHNVLVNIKDNEGKLLKVIPENELKDFLELEVEEEMNEITEHIVEIKKREDVLNNKLINIKKISGLRMLNEVIYTGEKIIEEVNQIKELLNVNIANVSNDVLDKFNAIKQKNNTIGKEEWLKDGLRLYEQNGNCPFCGQIINNTNEDIKIYNQIFSEQIVDIFEKIEYYETQYQYKDDINYIKSLSNNKYVAIDGIEDTMKSIGYDEHYRQILSQQEKINTQNGIIELKMKEIKAQICRFLELKKRNITSEYDIEINDLIKEVNIQIDNVEKYNEQINEINSFLAQKQIDIQNEEKNIQSKIDEVKIELKSMANIQKRKQYDDICKMYIANKQLKDKLEAEKNEKSKLFEKVESEYVNKYFECINNNFKKLSSRDFEIFKSISRKGKISTYEIKIKYKGIEINSSDIKFCMSESDRRALGFSIFLAKLDLMPDEVISKQIIIMDDPFTSFDDNRLNSSNEIIRRLYERSEQVIIITHYKAHISTLCKRNSEMDKKIFAIKHLNLKSMLEEYSDEVYIDNEYIKSIKKANKFINGHISDYDISDLRKLLETNINERFAYHLIGHNKMSLSEKIKFLKENGIISEDLFNEYDAKREFSNLEHHDWFDMSNADKVNTVQQFLDTVSK